MKKVQITVVTFQGHHNYGAMLQAYGLQEHLFSLGYKVQFLNYMPAHIISGNRKVPKINSVKNLLKYVALLPLKRRLEKRHRLFESFRKKELELGELYQTYDELAGFPPKTDLYICGSDQIWNFQNGGNPVFFLDFLGTETVPALSYAASMGTGTLPEKHEDQFREWVKIYRHISVREKSSVEVVSRFTEKPVHCVLDPIFLLGRDRWEDIAGERPLKERYLAFYSLETSGWIVDCVKWFAKALGLKVVILGKPGSLIFQKRCHVALDSGPREFVSWIYHADFVVTNSFHATAFSCYFDKACAIIPHTSRNSRMENLVNLLQCEDKLLELDEVLTEERLKTLMKGISPAGEQALADAQGDSKRYLIDSLSDLGMS